MTLFPKIGLHIAFLGIFLRGTKSFAKFEKGFLEKGLKLKGLFSRNGPFSVHIK